jgi:hypothetical protein
MSPLEGRSLPPQPTLVGNSRLLPCAADAPTSPSAIRLLALDIDGTLVNSQNELTAATRDALLKLAGHGVRLVLATGRRYSRALPLVEPLGLDAPLVTASGSLIKSAAGHQTLFKATFEPRLLREFLAILDSRGYHAVLYADSFAEGFDYYCPALEPNSPELADFYTLNEGCGRVWPTLMRDPPEGIFSGFAIGTRPAMLELAAELEERLPGRLYIHVLRSPRYVGFMCEICPGGVSKWTGIRHLAEQWGIADHEICAVGDDVNDIPMIQSAGLGIAMGNALDEVKAAADRIAPSNDEEGLVQVVEWILRGRA